MGWRYPLKNERQDAWRKERGTSYSGGSAINYVSPFTILLSIF